MKTLLNSARTLLQDMASTILFLVMMVLTKNVVLSVIAGMALGAGQITWQLARRQKIDLMQAMSFFLVIASGLATLWTHDPRFVLIKPSAIYLIIGIVMLRPGWMLRYLPGDAIQVVPDVATVFGFVWAGLMFVSAGVNLYAGLHMTPLAWAKFMSIYGLASKGGLFLISYATMRHIGHRRWHAAHPEAAAPEAAATA
jgi:intracellular septation protein